MVYSKRKTDALFTTKKTLYGTLLAALLFWRLLSDTLQEWGFKINQYDQCLANKNIEGKQCTILWHVHDLKISHGNHNVKLTEKF